MGLKINTTIPALNAQRETTKASGALNKTLEKLASGLRINRAADDAAGLAIAEGFRTQVRQYTQEINNLQTGVNVIETADQAIGTQQDALGRIQELAVQAANGTLTDDQRSALNQEAQQLVQQIQGTADTTQFNGTQLLNGTAGTINLGVEGGTQINLNATTTAALGLNGLDLGTQGGAAAALGTLANAASQLNQNRAGLGAQQNGLLEAINVRETATTNATESESRLRDLDVARGVIEQTRNQLLLRQSTAALIQGNLIPQAAAQLLGS